jgi:ABC-type transporter Mla MlaB component
MAYDPARLITINTPLARADLPSLYSRVCKALCLCAGSIAVCDVAGSAADAVVLEALCRLQLGARRWWCEVRLRNASRELLALVELCGLDDVIKPESPV